MVTETAAIVVGDRVRSYDFPDSRDRNLCYVEGVVERIGLMPSQPDCDRYHVRVDRVVWDGAEDDANRAIGLLVFPPVNGTPTWLGGVTDGVEKVVV